MTKKILVGCIFLSSVTFAQAQVSETPTQVEIEQTVREVFADTPEMIEIARCESKFRQFTDAGNVLRGGYGNNMVGVFQFYDRYHAAGALALGFDLTTVDGNLAYAQHTYNLSGTTPWNSSKHCWHNTTSQPTYPLASAAITTTTPNREATTMTDAQMREKIALLQQLIKLLQTMIALKNS